jgi:hypothetical protein
LIGQITLSQEKYINDILERFRKLDACTISTPSLTNEHLKKLTSPEVDPKPYQWMLGVLMYAMLRTRPDLVFTMAVLRQHTANPSPHHQHALNCAFRYLKATKDNCLTFQRGSPNGSTLIGYVDADWASDMND